MRDLRRSAVPTTSIYSRADGVVNWRTCPPASSLRRKYRGSTRQSCGVGVNGRRFVGVAERLPNRANLRNLTDRGVCHCICASGDCTILTNV